MHEYAVFNHSRSAIGRWLGILSLLAMGGISQVLVFFYSMTGWEAFTQASISTGLVYFLLHYLFSNYLWKFKLLMLRFTDIPDLSGEWDIVGQTLNDEGGVRFNWNGKIGIEQDWEKIQIHLQTKTSQSFSYTAALFHNPGPIGGWILSYSYRNEPELSESHELNAHKGYCEIQFDQKLEFGKARYFNSGGRKTYGEIELKRVKND